MKLLSTIKQKISNLFRNEETTINEPVYFDSGASIICRDKEGIVTMTSSIVAEHIDDNTKFPRFSVVNTTAKEGMLSFNLKRILNLTTDNVPTQGSKNLMTSGDIYTVINDLQNQINDLKGTIK